MSEARLKRNPLGNPAEGVEGGIIASYKTPPQVHTLRLPPYVDPALVDYLLHVYKVHVRADYTLREYDRQVGHSEVITHLQQIVNDQKG